MSKQYDKQFKLDAVQYYNDHKELGLAGCANNFGISQQTIPDGRKNYMILEILNVVVLEITLLKKKRKLPV